MLFSFNWIARLVDIPDDPDDVAQRLTDAGLAVEGVERVTLSNGSQDVVYDIDITTNRVDAMCHLGLAREAAVLYGRPLRKPEVELSEATPAAGEQVGVEVEDFALCPRYSALMIRGVTVGPSPEWLVERLEAIGQRSINNIVDITNFVLWETGQPLHAFDLDTLGEPPALRVRRARPGERLTTLDGEARQLDPDILVIADAERPVALGGILGGLDTEVTAATRNILLESAHFDPATVRRGAKKLGLHTDACHRFERGTDPEGCLWAARHAAALMARLAGGEVQAGAVDVRGFRASWPPRVELDLALLNRFGGTEIPRDAATTTLTGLGFELEELAAGRWRVTVPPWRWYDFDNAWPADVYEEVLRIHGLDRIPSTLPQIAGADAPESPTHRLRRLTQDVLAAGGFAEAINYAFHDRQTDAEWPSLWAEAAAVEIDNPLSERYAVMRRAVLPGLVESARYNLRRGAAAVRLFEIGHIFCRAAAREAATNTPGELHHEQETLALVAGGRLGTPWERPAEIDFYDLKGVLETLASELGVELALTPVERPKLVRGTAAEIRAVRSTGDGDVIGHLGQLDDAELPCRLYVAELALEGLLTAGASLEVSLPSRFPGIAVDSTLTHSLEVPWAELAGVIGELAGEELTDFGLKDRYRGQGVPAGAVNTTIWFLYNSPSRSLTQEEVNQRHRTLASELESRFGWSAATPH